MKVEQTKTFTPVIITLETQEEVDALFAVFNCFRIVDALSPTFCISTHKKIERFVNRPNSMKYWGKIVKELK